MESISIGPLEGFYWVATTGGYARAVRAMPYPLTEPAVHKQVRKLEHALGVRLFERVAKDRVQLTAAGSYLFEHVGPFVRNLPAVMREVSSHSHGGLVRIDATGIVIRDLLPEWVANLARTRPDICVDIKEIASAEVSRLRDALTDIIIDYAPSPPAGCAAKQVARIFPYIVVPAPGGRKPRRPRPAALTERTFISYNPGRVQHELQMAALEAMGIQPQRTLSVSTMETITRFVAAGVGWSIVPWLAAKPPKVAGLTAYHTRGTLPDLPVFAMWRATRAANPLVEALLTAGAASQKR